MSTTTTAVAAIKGPTFTQRKSRTLIGWLAEAEGALWIAGRRMSQSADPAHLAACRAARGIVSSRAGGCDQSGIVSQLPPSLDGHIAALRSHPKTAAILAESGSPQLVDLRKVCAAQPTIHTEDATKRIASVNATDIQALAGLTIPVHAAAELPVSFDELKNAWLMSSPNPNLRVSGHFSGELQPGITGFGFTVEVSQSYVQVVSVGGRYFLRDGYHRAYGLLAAGIHFAPALVRNYDSIEDVKMPAGLLSPATYLGDRPPLLLDYLDDQVSANSSVPITSKMIVIQALEVSAIA